MKMIKTFIIILCTLAVTEVAAQSVNVTKEFKVINNNTSVGGDLVIPPALPSCQPENGRKVELLRSESRNMNVVFQVTNTGNKNCIVITVTKLVGSTITSTTYTVLPLKSTQWIQGTGIIAVVASIGNPSDSGVSPNTPYEATGKIDAFIKQ
jgi:hypothetical protein